MAAASKLRGPGAVPYPSLPLGQTIQQQWNLPALTYRDADAATLADFLSVARMSFPEPPSLAAPANPLPGLLTGYPGQPVPPAPGSTVPAGS